MFRAARGPLQPYLTGPTPSLRGHGALSPKHRQTPWFLCPNTILIFFLLCFSPQNLVLSVIQFARHVYVSTEYSISSSKRPLYEGSGVHTHICVRVYVYLYIDMKPRFKPQLVGSQSLASPHTPPPIPHGPVQRLAHAEGIMQMCAERMSRC